MKRDLTRPTAALLLMLSMGAFTPASSGESRPTLKFAGSTPAIGAIEEAFTMTLDNLIGINSIPYDPEKWNDTGLLETAAESRFLRAAPSYGDNPWVHDGAYNTWSAMNLLEANDGRATHVARNTLWACCDVVDGKLVVNIRQSAHSEWYMYQLWNIAAWHYYQVNGDAAFLAKAYEAATQVLAKQEGKHFNADYGLFKGSYFVGDGASGFPEPPFEPDRHSSNALQYTEVHQAMVLSTNCVYVGAYRATAAMARELGRPPAEAAGWQAKADRLAAAINRHLWMPEQGRYGFFIHGTGTRKAGTLDPTQEGGGLSFAILFGVADAARTKRLLENVHRQPKGITMSWPHFKRFSDEKPGRHNVAVWPQINGLFAQAACVGGRVDLFQSEVENLAGLFRGSGKIREIYHHLSGEHCGGFQMNSSGKITHWQAVGNQAWGAGAFSRMIYDGLFGMDFETGGIRLAPTLPAAWGEVRLGDIQYRGMTLNITLKGDGNAIRGVEINGKPAAEPFVSGDLQGTQNVTIWVAPQPPAGPAPTGSLVKWAEELQTDGLSAERRAELHGLQSAEALRRCRKYIDGWMPHFDPVTGLVPRNFDKGKNLWNGKDAGADNYSFMVLTSALTDRPLYEGRMLDIQKRSGVIEGWHGDGNYARTAIMWALWKQQGTTIQPWRFDTKLGAVLEGKKLSIVLTTGQPWQGTLHFDQPRHKTIMKMPLDYPRINQFPEWYTVDPERTYSLRIGPETKTFPGQALIDGIPLTLKAGEKLKVQVD